jgi:hypothetical protein
MQPSHYNYEGKTGFGMPWEICYYNDQMWYTKGGDLLGYQTFFGVLPATKVGLVVLNNGPAMDQVRTYNEYNIYSIKDYVRCSGCQYHYAIFDGSYHQYATALSIATKSNRL